jgi:bacterioferritin
MFRNWGFERLNDYNYKQSIRVMKEADEIIERVLFLEGLPNLQNLGKLMIGENVGECLKYDLEYERDVQRPLLVEAVALAESESDFVSRDLLQGCWKPARKPSTGWRTQLGLIDTVTLPNYLQSQIDD